MPKTNRSTSGPSPSGTVDRGTVDLTVARARELARPSAHPTTHPLPEEETAGPDRGQQGPRLSADLQAVIGQQLRAVYHEILNEPVPDRFVRLLNELATKEASPQ